MSYIIPINSYTSHKGADTMPIHIATLIGFELNILPFLYFLDQFLKPRYNQIRTWIYSSLVISFTILCNVIPFFYTDMPIKTLCVLAGLYITVMFFYTGSIFRKITAPFLIISILMVVEMPMDFILLHIFDMDLTILQENAFLFLFIQALYNIVVLLVCMIIFKLAKHHMFLYQQPRLFCMMTILLFLQIADVTMIQMMSFYQRPLQEAFYVLLICAILIVCLIILILYELKQLYHRTKVEYTMKKLEIEYQSLLEEYMEVNDDTYRYLRHDVMNLLLQKQYQKEDE